MQTICKLAKKKRLYTCICYGPVEFGAQISNLATLPAAITGCGNLQINFKQKVF